MHKAFEKKIMHIIKITEYSKDTSKQLHENTAIFSADECVHVCFWSKAVATHY